MKNSLSILLFDQLAFHLNLVQTLPGPLESIDLSSARFTGSRCLAHLHQALKLIESLLACASHPFVLQWERY